MLSKGDGTFTSITTPGSGASGIVSSGPPLSIGDFNGDGKADLALFISGSEGGQYSTAPLPVGTVWFGNGDGTFIPASASIPNIETGYNISYAATSAAALDSNGDGIVDLVAGEKLTGVPPSATQPSTQGFLNYFSAPLSVSATASINPLSIPNPNPYGSSASAAISATYSGDSIYPVTPVSTPLAVTTIPFSTLTLSPHDTSSYAGTSITFTATLSPYTGQGHATDGESVTFTDGSVPIGTATLSSGVATLTTSLSGPGDAHAIYANYAGDTSFAPAQAEPADVSLQPAFLTFSIPSHAYGDAPFTIAATSASTGAITYSVVNGPVTLAGNTVTITGAGSAVLKASIAAAAQYPAAVQTATFSINPAPLTVTVNNLPESMEPPIQSLQVRYPELSTTIPLPRATRRVQMLRAL